MKKIALFISLLLVTGLAFSQNRNNVWCFGDSARIDFINGIAIAKTSSVDGRGSCASIANNNGQLLFYAAVMHAYASSTTYSTIVFDSTDNIMTNGDSIFGRNWYQELVIIPNPANDSTYYLFSIGVVSVFGLSYSVIDMRMNGGLGEVVNKNIFLQTFEQTDCLNAIKHGNGRDWWLIYRKSDASTGNFNSDWYEYLITPFGIQPISTQSIGQQNRTNLGHISFSPNGDKVVFNNLLNVVDLYDFDRCTGLLSNAKNIEIDPGSGPYPLQWSSAFSSDGSKLYVTTNNDTSYLFQYDLNSVNIGASKDTIWISFFPEYACGALKLGPDNRIYLSSLYSNGINSAYPFADSVYNNYNMNLSVINYPDSLSSASDFQPYSFYLGGKRTYLGLPNNPDYEMGPLIGSPCDSLTSITETPVLPEANLFVYYSSDWQTAFINADKLKGHTYNLEVFDLMGKSIFRESGKLNPPYFTRNLNCSAFSYGVYMVRLVTEREKLTRKFVISNK